jgi:NAD(P)-dependent dehydrogenase (short-subunit alcohol dehydrogenase family)
MNLRDRTFIVTGGTGDLGGAVTREFLEAGARLAVTWRHERAWRALEPELAAYGDDVAGFRMDVTDPSDVSRGVSLIVEQFGAVHGVAHLVGGFDFATVENTSADILDRMLDMNLCSAFHVAKAAAPVIRAAGGGKLLFVSARAALQGASGLGAYAASKAGVIALVQTLADEYRDANIQTNCVLPSIIDTPANRTAMPDADFTRWVAPADIARVLRFLASSDAEVISGAAIPVYGRA